MKVWFRVTDDLGFIAQHVDVLEAEGPWQALERIVADSKLKERFGIKPNFCLNLEVMPLHRREGVTDSE